MTMSIDSATPEEWKAAVEAVNFAVSWAKGGCSMDEINRALDMRFGDVNLWHRCLAFALWQQGHPIEVQSAVPGEWWPVAHPHWCVDGFFRVLPKPEELVLPSIDWSHVAPQWKWLVQDEGGVVTLFDHRPMLSEPVGLWGFAAVGGKFLRADNFASAKPGKGDWRKLIVQRPEGA